MKTYGAPGANDSQAASSRQPIRFGKKDEAATPPVNWSKRLSIFKEANNLRAVFELALTLSLFILFWLLAYFLFQFSIAAAFVSIIPAGVMMVRLFIIQHDCGHGAFFHVTAGE